MVVHNIWGSGMAIDAHQARQMIRESAELDFEMFHLDSGWCRGLTTTSWRVRPSGRQNLGQPWLRFSLGPRLFNVDSSLAKNFSLYKGVMLEMIVQTYNLFNHVNCGQPNTCIDCLTPNTGLIQGTVSAQDGTSMRHLKFGARIQF